MIKFRPERNWTLTSVISEQCFLSYQAQKVYLFPVNSPYVQQGFCLVNFNIANRTVVWCLEILHDTAATNYQKKQRQEQNKTETRKNKEYMVGQCFCQPDSKLNAINLSTTLDVMSPTVPVKNVITKNIRFPLRPSGKSWISFKRMEGLASQRNSSAVSMGKWLTKLTPWAPAIPALAG